MKRPQLKVEKRTVIGKKVRKLRRDGILPANIYGKDIKSVSVQVPIKEFITLYKEVGKTGLIDAEFDGKARPVLIHEVHINPITRAPLHADLYQVNLKEKITTMVPVVITGEPAAVTEKIGLLMQTLSEVEVEALPEALPENIEVNVEKLAAIGDQVTVGDVKVPSGVTILTDSGQVIVKIDELVSEEAKADAEAAAAVAEEAAAESETEEAGNAEEVKEEGKEASEDKEVKKEEKPDEKKAE